MIHLFIHAFIHAFFLTYIYFFLQSIIHSSMPHILPIHYSRQRFEEVAQDSGSVSRFRIDEIASEFIGRQQQNRHDRRSEPRRHQSRRITFHAQIRRPRQEDQGAIYIFSKSCLLLKMLASKKTIG